MALGTALLLGGTVAAGTASRALIGAAKKEGKVVRFTGLGIPQGGKVSALGQDRTRRAFAV